MLAGDFIWYVRTAYLFTGIEPTCHIIRLFIRSVVPVAVISVPYSFVFMPGFAGVQPLDTCSCTVAEEAAAHPLLCTVSCESNTSLLATVWGVSRITSSIEILLLSCIEYVAFLLLAADG
ncbi:Uncharacterised protein [uncultured archaeon]|nr:Uncharacterised protein [uncultured archaeon]